MEDVATTTRSDAIEIGGISDPGVRRILRKLNEQYLSLFRQQQRQIETLTSALVEKNVCSLAELKLMLARQNEKGRDRVHQAMTHPDAVKKFENRDLRDESGRFIL